MVNRVALDPSSARTRKLHASLTSSETTNASPRLVHLCMMQLREYKNEVNELLHLR